MYYLKYLEKTDENLEIQNLKQTIEFAYDELCNKKVISIHLANRMHEILLNSVRGAKKAQENVIELLNNLYEYMNDAFIDPLLINVAISHAQFETIHAYKDGNGRVGRALIPIQMVMLEDGKPILYLSEVIELYKPSNQRILMESRRGNLAGFIKFFLQCVIDQCTSYINKINRID